MNRRSGDSEPTLETVKEDLLEVQQILLVKTGSSIDLAAIRIQKLYESVEQIQEKLKEVKG